MTKAFYCNIIFLILFVVCSASLIAQTPHDYEKWPVQDYRFHDLALHLNLDVDDVNLSGSAVYQVSAFSSLSDSLRLNAIGLSVESVELNGVSADFIYENDLLSIHVPENLRNVNRTFEVEIVYETRNPFGLLQSHNGTVFSSNIPFARASWFPVFESPYVELSFALHIRVPAGNKVVSNGLLNESVTSDDGSVTFRWFTEGTIPVTGIAFAAGRLDYEESVLGFKPVRIYSETETSLNTDKSGILRNTLNNLSAMQRKIRKEYPFEAFNVIMMDDHIWEPAAYGAGMAFIFENSGDKLSQIQWAADAQWFGVYQRSPGWQYASAQLAVLNALADERGSGWNLNRIHFPDVNITEWTNILRANELNHQTEDSDLSEFKHSIILGSLQNLMALGSGVFSWQDYSRKWFLSSGRPFEEPQLLRVVSEEHKDKVLVLADFSFRDEGRNLVIDIETGDNLPSGSYELEIRLDFRSGSETKTIDFNQSGGEVVLELQERPANVSIIGGSDSILEFIERKEFGFWLHQLREGQTIEDRIQAAREMPRFRDDPDIQLALGDLMQTVTEPQVKAALIRSLADIVAGASGTHQQFIALARDAGGDVLTAVMEALWYYEGNQASISAAARTAMTVSETGPALAAIATFRNIAPEEQFMELAASVLLGDRPYAIKAGLLDELFRTNDRETAILTAVDILNGAFPYSMRIRAFELLVRNRAIDELRPLFTRLAEDNDPRVRLAVIQNIDFLAARQMNDLLEQRYSEERDPRVRQAFNDL